MIPTHEGSRHAVDQAIVDHLSIADGVYWQAKDNDTEAQVLRAEAAKLGIRRNSRSKLPHLTVDTAFRRLKISPTSRTRYAQALLAADSQSLTTEEFRRVIGIGPTGRGGLKDLANTVARRRPSPITGAGVPAANNHDVDGPGVDPSGQIILGDEVKKEIARLGLKPGQGFALVVTLSTSGRFKGVRCLSPSEYSVPNIDGVNVASCQGGGNV
jgi:hypothetical protein